MTERPILFNDAMVRAILGGRKTVTRRPVKEWQLPSLDAAAVEDDPKWIAIAQRHSRYGFAVYGETEDECAQKLAAAGVCPIAQVGDRLWVREAWEDVHPVQVTEGRYSQPGRAGIPGPPGVTYQTIYRSDGPYPQVYHSNEHPYRSLSPVPGRLKAPAECGWVGWSPSIHMPRWASRIQLEVTAVRIERVQAISLDQIRAEGLDTPLEGDEAEADLRGQWKALWETTGGDWLANPWVWVVEFRVATRGESH